MGIEIKVKLRSMSMQKPVSIFMKYDIDKLKDENTDRDYKNNEHILKLNAFTESGDTDEMWKEFKEFIKEVTNTTIEKKKSFFKLWFNTICEEAIIRRKLARQKWLEDMDNKDNFRRFRTRQKEVQNIIRCKKRKFIKKQQKMRKTIIVVIGLESCINK